MSEHYYPPIDGFNLNYIRNSPNSLNNYQNLESETGNEPGIGSNTRTTLKVLNKKYSNKKNEQKKS